MVETGSFIGKILKLSYFSPVKRYMRHISGSPAPAGLISFETLSLILDLESGSGFLIFI